MASDLEDGVPGSAVAEACTNDGVLRSVAGQQDTQTHMLNCQPIVERRSVTAPPAAPCKQEDLQPQELGRITSCPPATSKIHPEDGAKQSQSVRRPLLQRTVTGASWFHSLSRNISSSQVRPTVCCTICMDHIPETESATIKACGRRAHGSCTDCLARHLKIRIDDGRVGELTCPGTADDVCDAEASELELQQLLDSDSVEKYFRFKRIKEDKKVRQCPECNEFCQAEMRTPGDESSGVIAEMCCNACGCMFCYYHSNAHARGAEACAAYERNVIKMERAAIAQLGTKRCPGCGIITEKTSGCNHMTCVTCRAEWCWLCGKVITNIGWHYSPLRFGTCQQFVQRDVRRETVRLHIMLYITKLISIIVFVVVLLFYLLFFLACVVLLVVFACPGCCCCCCLTCANWILKEWDVDAVSHTGTCLFVSVLGIALLVTGVPFFFFCVAWAILMVPLWVIMVPCGADNEQLKTLVTLPPVILLGVMQFLE